MKAAVVNASPLIILARAGYLPLLPELIAPIMVPRAVLDEILAGPADDTAVKLVPRSGWLQVIEPAENLTPLADWRLGRGETAVLEFARRNPGTMAVLDDRAARRAARLLGLPLTGTLGLLVAATQAGLIHDFPSAIDAVLKAGLYVDPATQHRLIEELRH